VDLVAALTAPLVPLDRSLEIGILRGIVAHRWLTISWAAVALYFQREHLTRPELAIPILGAAAFTLFSTLAIQNDGRWLMLRRTMVIEATIAGGLLLADGVIWGGVDLETRRQSLPWAWPQAVILTIGAMLGLRAGVLVAAVLAALSW
jgi:hypothetical protein